MGACGLNLRLLITGSREWTDWETIRDAFAELHHHFGTRVVLVSGHCLPRREFWDGDRPLKSADAICEYWALLYGWEVERHPAEWNRYGKGAGRRRNAQMVALGAHRCLAFILDGSSGSTDCAAKAEMAKIPVTYYRAVSA